MDKRAQMFTQAENFAMFFWLGNKVAELLSQIVKPVVRV